ncbi:MAG: metallophosphatase family protein [Coriobacteriales bacterium]|jgi:putative phosphoesterase|nr:metallophosphatase family protein [Coriobacteriales bacterium]
MADTYRVGIISDTHGKTLPEGVLGAFGGCDYILHAGDIGSVSVWHGQIILDELGMIAPVTAVLGNSPGDLADEYFTNTGKVAASISNLTIGGVRFFMTHSDDDLYHLKQQVTLLSDEQPVPERVWIHGHTHRRKWLPETNSHTICPGAIHLPRDGNHPGVAVLTIEGAKVKDVAFIDL